MARSKNLRGCQISTTTVNSQQEISSHIDGNQDVEEAQAPHIRSGNNRSSHSTHSPQVESEEAQLHQGDNDAYENIEISDEHGHVKVKRGETHAGDVWTLPEGHKILVDCNELAQPVDKAAGVLSSWLGTVARNGSLCPLCYDDWRKLRKDCGDDLLELVKSKFLFPSDQCVDAWILESLNHKWREYKHKLKQMYMPADLEQLQPSELEEKKIQVMLKVPRRINPEHWNVLVYYWFSPKSKKRSAAGKLARSVGLERGTALHTTGSMSFARKKHQYAKETGRELGRIELFEITRTKKNPNEVNGDFVFVNDASREKVAEAKRLLDQRLLSDPGSSDETIENQVYNEVFGLDKFGRTKGYGLGVKSGYDKVSIVNNKSKNKEMEALRAQMNLMKEQIEVLQSQARNNKSNNDNMSGLPINNGYQVQMPFLGIPSQEDILKNYYLLQAMNGSLSASQFNNKDDGLRNLFQIMNRPPTSATFNQEEERRTTMPLFGHPPSDPRNNSDWGNVLNFLGESLVAPQPNNRVTDKISRPTRSDQNINQRMCGSPSSQ